MLIAPVLELACVGMDLVNKAMVFRGSVAKETSEKAPAFKALIQASEMSLRRVIAVNADLVIDKIEQDRLEELGSRIKNIGLFFKLGRTDELFSYMMLLNESVDYANNRIKENKDQWIAPYLMGKAMALAVLNYLGHEDEQIFNEIVQTTKSVKHKILNQSTKLLLTADNDIPWDLYHNVLNDTPGSVNELIESIKNASMEDGIFNSANIGNTSGGAHAGKDAGLNANDDRASNYCRKCGGALLPNAAFCNRCGVKIEQRREGYAVQ